MFRSKLLNMSGEEKTSFHSFDFGEEVNENGKVNYLEGICGKWSPHVARNKWQKVSKVLPG